LDSKELSIAIKAIQDSVASINTDVGNLYDGQTQILTKVTLVEAAQANLDADMTGLTKVVRDGNGQPSLMQRVTTVETQRKTDTKEIDKLRGHYNSAATARVLSKGQMTAGITGMIITALLAASSLAVALFN
jgi:hypothetical protein